jgi:hypothetical protein
MNLDGDAVSNAASAVADDDVARAERQSLTAEQDSRLEPEIPTES